MAAARNVEDSEGPAGRRRSISGQQPRVSRATGRSGDQSPFALGLVMRRAHTRAVQTLVEAIKPWGLEFRHFAVMINLSSSGPMNQTALTQATGSDKASMVRVVDDLERRGLVERRPVPGDRRVHEVALTARGLEVFDEAHQAALPISQELVGQFTREEADQLLDLLERFSDPPQD